LTLVKLLSEPKPRHDGDRQGRVIENFLMHVVGIVISDFVMCVESCFLSSSYILNVKQELQISVSGCMLIVYFVADVAPVVGMLYR
jgi:hypothetical protein